MPLFDYRCRHCGHEFEVLQFGQESPCCEQCGSAEVEKLLSRFAVKSGGTTRGGQPGSGTKCGGCAGGNCASCH